jgi:tetratricopeptide (TPR) repeat protein
MPQSPTHHVIRTGTPGARIGDLDAALPQPVVPPVDAHRRLRGPYTAAGTLLRAIVPDAVGRCPELVAAHGIEILAAAPELAALLRPAHETLTSLAVPEERTRFYSRARTLCLAHGITEFLRDYLRTTGQTPAALVIDRVDQADPTDQEFAAVLLRRLDPAEVTLVLGLGDAPDPASPLGLLLADGTGARVSVSHARTDDGARALVTGTGTGSATDEARRYVEAECTAAGRSGERLRAAYESLTEQQRARLHDERAQTLEALGQTSLALGAIPFHRERGSDHGAAVRALTSALDHCVDLGLYEATVDLGIRGRALVDWSAETSTWWAFTTRTTTSLAALGRSEEAEELYDEARAFTDAPSAHQHAAYATAMLYTQHHGLERKDHRRALGLVNQAIAFAKQLPDAEERAFATVFAQNGRALIENHLGRPGTALRLLSDGLERLEQELDGDRHRLHRSVLRHNRAQVYAALGRLDEAVADYTRVIAEDPNYPEYHFDLGNLLRRLDRDEEALAEYETAMRLSPPFPELYYNRGDVRAAQGDLAGAVADFRYVLELDPGYADASVNLAGLLAEMGDGEAARAVATAGVAAAPGHPHLHCLLGRLALDAGDAEAAEAALDRALTHDPLLPEAWALHGTLRYQRGDLPAAVEALSRALEAGPDPSMYFNRGAVYEELRMWDAAAADFSSALDLDPDDADTLRHHLACLSRIEAPLVR